MKNVLVIYYSQSGQLEAVAKSVTAPMVGGGSVQLHFHEIEMEQPFPFPWNKEAFFRAFPESFLQIPQAVKPVREELKGIHFDLVLFCYQVWYLSPSIPITSFLKSADAGHLLKDVPVVTISGSRNMWIMAQEKVKGLLAKNGATLVGNLALVDRAPNLVSVITIVKWMMSGIKKRFYGGLLPLPGISESDVAGAKKFGEIILKHTVQGNFDGLQSELIGADAVKVSPYLVTVDKTANRIFSKWSNIIIKKKNRRIWEQAFYVYLFLAIWIASPIVYIFHIVSVPLRTQSIKRAIAYYQGV